MSDLKETFLQRERPYTVQRGENAETYILQDDRLIAAARIAIELGQPLILAGEPGVGKTAFAHKLHDELATPSIIMHPEINVSTTTDGRSLLYVFDEVKRFHKGNVADAKLVDYVVFTPFGRAILWAAGPDATVRLNPAMVVQDVCRCSPDAEGRFRLGDLFPNEFNDYDGKPMTQPSASIVLLDEFDKAPRDAPNDLLRAVERMSFEIVELGLRIEVAKGQEAKAWPIVILTSNSERSFPDAFLRRCIFHWISFPDADSGLLERIVAAHCAADSNGRRWGKSSEDLKGSAFVNDTVALLYHMRAECVNKKPATGELLAFATVLMQRGFGPDSPVAVQDPAVQGAFGALLKTREDLRRFGLIA